MDEVIGWIREMNPAAMDLDQIKALTKILPDDMVVSAFLLFYLHTFILSYNNSKS